MKHSDSAIRVRGTKAKPTRAYKGLGFYVSSFRVQQGRMDQWRALRDFPQKDATSPDRGEVESVRACPTGERYVNPFLRCYWDAFEGLSAIKLVGCNHARLQQMHYSESYAPKQMGEEEENLRHYLARKKKGQAWKNRCQDHLTPRP